MFGPEFIRLLGGAVPQGPDSDLGQHRIIYIYRKHYIILGSGWAVKQEAKSTAHPNIDFFFFTFFKDFWKTGLKQWG